MANQWQGQKSVYIVANGTVNIVEGPGFLHSVSVNVASGDVTLYDSLVGSGTIIGYFKANTTSSNFILDCEFGTGLTAVTSGSPATTITFSEVLA